MMTILLRKFMLNPSKNACVGFCDNQILLISSRNINLVPTVYENDPAPKFFSPKVQTLLKRLTRPDFDRVFRKRTNRGFEVLPAPVYKFLTTEELEKEVVQTQNRANKLLQMPPVVKVQTPINEVLSKDPAIIGYDTAKYIFTDITFGIPNEKRIIVERDPDGILRNSDHDIRKRLNQAYFPIVGRKIREPKMFSDPEKLHSLLDRAEYEFVLDRACLQYEPDEPSYHRVTSIAYQHVDMKKSYELLRSTRHFGPLTFYLSWHRSVENLLLELLQNNYVREAVLVVALRHTMHNDVGNGDEALNMVEQILSTPIQLSKPDSLTEADIQLDNKCMECVEKYINNNSTLKAQQELALQGFREWYQQLIDLTRGLKKAHGQS